VKNGETLKAAAKRHRINYSSAKSILHTYRKEGRILKKSAQERTIKKKVLSSPEPRRVEKTPKSSRKENEHTVHCSRKTPQSLTPLGERKKFQMDTNQYNEEESPFKSTKDIKASVEAPKPIKEELTVMDHVDNSSVNYASHVDGIHSNRMAYREETPRQKEGKLFENFFMNYSDAHTNEAGFGHTYAEGPECTNYMYYPREFESFNDMVTSLQGNQSHVDDLYSRGFNMPSGMEDKHIKMEHGAHFEESGENFLNCPLKSFMDTQNVFRDALRKTSFYSYNGNSNGLRKSSMDFF